MIKVINGWRGLFAVMIVLFHVGVAQCEEMTWAGVSFFIMASGMLLAMRHPMERLDGAAYRKFACRHALKLFPLHWLTLALWLIALAAVGALAVKPVTLALNALLLHSWSLLHSVYFSCNRFSWFLSTLLLCYLCYPLLARWFMPLRLRHKAVVMGVLVAADVALLAVTGHNVYWRTALYVFPPERLIDFMLGMTLAHACRLTGSRGVLGKSDNGTDAELVAVALLSAVVMTFRACPSLLPWSDAVIWWLPVALILLVSVAYDRREGFVGRLLASRPMQWLGDISFEIFMLQGIAALAYNYLLAPVLAHFDVPAMMDVVARDMGFTGAIAIAWFIVPVDVLLAWLVNRLFTRPLRRLLPR